MSKLLKCIKNVVAEKGPLDKKFLDLEIDFKKDLDYECLDLVELLHDIEKAVKKEFPGFEGNFEGLEARVVTIGDLIECIKQKLELAYITSNRGSRGSSPVLKCEQFDLN